LGWPLERADWLYGLIKGLNVIEFMPGFVEAVQSLGKATNALWAKMIDTDLLQDGYGEMGC
jgi:hypothetical protein